MYEELKAHNGKAVFFTLTYDEKNVPKNYLYESTISRSASDYGYDNTYIDDKGREKVLPICKGERKHHKEAPETVLQREYGLDLNSIDMIDFNVKRKNHKEFIEHVQHIYGDYLRLVSDTIPSNFSSVVNKWNSEDVDTWFDNYDGDFFRFEDVDSTTDAFTEVLADDSYLDSADDICSDHRERPVMVFNSVRKKDVQDWIKRARSRRTRRAKKSGEPVQQFSFFVTSEYGPRTLRPHYHGVLFGVSAYETMDMKFDWQRHHGVMIDWQDVDLSKGDMSYCAKYCSKGMYEHPFCSKDFFYTHSDGSLTEYHSKNYERCMEVFGINEPIVDPTFHLVSKGLGIRFVEQNKERFTKDFQDIDFKRNAEVKPTVRVVHNDPTPFVNDDDSVYDVTLLQASDLEPSEEDVCQMFLFSEEVDLQAVPIVYDLSKTKNLKEDGSYVIKLKNIENDEFKKDFQECIEKLFNAFKYYRTFKDQTVSFGMPKYYRTKILSEGLRAALANYVQQVNVDIYREKFGQIRAEFPDRADDEIVLMLEGEAQEDCALRKAECLKKTKKFYNKSKL